MMKLRILDIRIAFGMLAAGMLLVGGGCQVLPLREVYDQNPPVRIVELTPLDSGNMDVLVTVSEPVQVMILAAADPAAELEPVGELLGAPGDTLTWSDAGVLATPGVRYYRAGVTLGDTRWQAPGEWAVFVQRRIRGQRALLAVPVDLGADVRLDGALGRQLAWGGQAGADTNDADTVAIMAPDGQWAQAFLKADTAGGDPRWWNPEHNTPAVMTIAPGQAFWHQRSPAAAADGVGLFWGRCYTRPTPVTIRLDARQGTPIGLPWSRPLHHPAPDVAPGQPVPPDPLGFGGVGQGGTTSDPRQPELGGDQIWVWKDGEWQGHFWLMDHIGPHRDGRWWDNRRRQFADFVLEPGIGYYYRHRPNQWGGADFVWHPPVGPEYIDR